MKHWLGRPFGGGSCSGRRRASSKKYIAWHALLLFGVLILNATGAIAGPKTNREITRTYSGYFLKKKKFERAIELLEAHLREDPTDAANWDLLGLSYLGRKDFDKAADAFEKAVEQTPKESPLRGQYHYRQADALVRAGEIEKAKVALNLAGRTESVRSDAAEAQKVMRTGQALPSLSEYTTSYNQLALRARTGFDTNVTLQNDDEVSASGSGASPFAMIGAEFENKRELFDQPFGTTAIGVFTYNSDPDASRFNTLFGSLGFDLYAGDPETDNWLHVFALGSSVMFLNSDGFGFYNFTQTLGWRPILRQSDSLTIRSFVPIRYQLYAAPSTGDAADERSGFGLRPEVAFDWTTDSGRWIFTGVFEWHQSRGQNYQTMGGRLPVKFLKNLDEVQFYSVDGELAYTTYPNSDDARKDVSFSLGGTYGRKLGDKWNGRFTYMFKRNASTDGDASYNKHLFQLEAVYDVF